MTTARAAGTLLMGGVAALVAPVVASPYGCGCRVGSAPATPARHAPLALLALLTLLALVGLRRATR